MSVQLRERTVTDLHVLATFTRRADADAAVAATKTRFADGDPRLGDADDELDALALGQQAEVGESLPLLAGGLFTGPFARGALVWGAVGFVVGALVGAVISIFFEPGWVPTWPFVAALALAGALGISSVTFILGAGRQAVKEGETLPEDPTAVVRVDAPGGDVDPIVSALAQAGARSTHVVAHPVPRPPTADLEAPRPVRPRSARSSEQAAQYDAGFEPDVG